jgi:hypothetical protein
MRGLDATKPRNAWGESGGFVAFKTMFRVCATLRRALPRWGSPVEGSRFPERHVAFDLFNEET